MIFSRPGVASVAAPATAVRSRSRISRRQRELCARSGCAHAAPLCISSAARAAACATSAGCTSTERAAHVAPLRQGHRARVAWASRPLARASRIARALAANPPPGRDGHAMIARSAPSSMESRIASTMERPRSARAQSAGALVDAYRIGVAVETPGLASRACAWADCRAANRACTRSTCRRLPSLMRSRGSVSPQLSPRPGFLDTFLAYPPSFQFLVPINDCTPTPPIAENLRTALSERRSGCPTLSIATSARALIAEHDKLAPRPARKNSGR